MSQRTISDQSQKDRTLRRVIYDAMIAARAALMLEGNGKAAFDDKEMWKISGLIMVRNLVDFFEGQPKKIHDKRHSDGFIDDLDCESFKPVDEGLLSNDAPARLSQIVAHIKRDHPPSFLDPEAIRVIKSFVKAAWDFVEFCQQHSLAVRDRSAGKFHKRLKRSVDSLSWDPKTYDCRKQPFRIKNAVNPGIGIP